MTERIINPSGPADAKILIVGEYPGADELWKGLPFQGASGTELARMLHEAGIMLSDCRLAYAYPWKPDGYPPVLIETTKPKAAKAGMTLCTNGKFHTDAVQAGLTLLNDEIARLKPDLIITLGEFALWAVTGESGITNWRGSLLEHQSGVTCIPTYSPQMILRAWEWRIFMVRDLKRARDYQANPDAYKIDYTFSIRPSFFQVMNLLEGFTNRARAGETVKLALDIETICRHISCLGIAWDSKNALCIPFTSRNSATSAIEHYWELHEEVAIVQALKTLLTHPRVLCAGQNFAGYDNQHFAKHWGFTPNLVFDTMLAQHTLYPGLDKALDVLSSLYCHYHRYWKDELKDYNKVPEDIHTYWTYNCKDCVITFEIWAVLDNLLQEAGLVEQFQFLMKMATRNVFRAMLRGVRIDASRRAEVSGELLQAINEREQLIHHIAGYPLNVGSPKQMVEFFYHDLGLPVIKNRKTKQPTCNSEALGKLAEKFPLVKPLTDLIEEKRSLGVFLSTFCLMPLDSDGRMRCSYNVAGTETFRLSSSENAFGSGGNLQNVPSGEEE